VSECWAKIARFRLILTVSISFNSISWRSPDRRVEYERIMKSFIRYKIKVSNSIKPDHSKPDSLLEIQLNQSRLESDREHKSDRRQKSGFLQVTLTTFVTVFLAELGDKTQLTTLMFTAQSNSPLIVFLGASIALVLSSLIGVIAGRWLAKNFSPQLLDTLAGLSFMLLAVGLLWDAVR